ncbi:MAG TPA: hypothetical protein VHC00_13030 [Rhizobiaceae bacterium]|nr:hypothetical protein [Rhizobiaceae bacterium]
MVAFEQALRLVGAMRQGGLGANALTCETMPTSRLSLGFPSIQASRFSRALARSGTSSALIGEMSWMSVSADDCSFDAGEPG